MLKRHLAMNPRRRAHCNHMDAIPTGSVADMFGVNGVRQIEGGRAVVLGSSRLDILKAEALGAQVGREALPDVAGM